MSAETIELDAGGGTRVLVAPALQGRVLTSVLPGAGDCAFVNAREIEEGERDRPFNNFGGQDRIWLGPEGGRFGFFFPPGSAIEGAHWCVPPPLHRGPFEVVRREASRVSMRRELEITNHAGTAFRVRIERDVELASPATLGVTLPPGVAAVGSRTTTTMTNAGETRWRADAGLPFLWVLGQFPASPSTWVIAPFRAGDARALGPACTDDYFERVPSERLRIAGGAAWMRADGRHVSKIGMSARRATGRAGAFDPDASRLTVVAFDLPAFGARVPSNLWPVDAPSPFGGDVFQAFNSGGEPRFFELESASCARELDPGESLTHRHATFFFHGDPEALDVVARAALGVEPFRTGPKS